MSDEADRLRDQLVAETEQRKMWQLKAERFEQALCKEVMEVVRKATSSQASADSYANACTSMQVRHLHEEIFRKDKEVERLKGLLERFQREVERLKEQADWKTPARKIQALEADVERLIRAGGAMEQRLIALSYFGEQSLLVQAWRVAMKECRHV